MGYVVDASDALERGPGIVGHKAWSLARMQDAGLNVPPFVCVTADAYDAVLDYGSLREEIALELSRRPADAMRWEEMWDSSLRIRNLFLKAPVPPDMEEELRLRFKAFGLRPMAVRSSAPGEDSADSSFAGIHESYITIKGLEALLTHVRLVWASLWSDAAILYRRELAIDTHSRMAVILQEMISGRCSGVAFWESPNHPKQSMIEAVHGLNQALVDGAVEPDRWVLHQDTGEVIEHVTPVAREQFMVALAHGNALQPLPSSLAGSPPLDERGVAAVHALAHAAVRITGAPQDVEWTERDERLYLLQSRPITTSVDQADGKKSWYLTLRRSFDSLCRLREEIEESILPAMARDADALGEDDHRLMRDDQLADTWDARRKAFDHWTSVYWDRCIPMAHGMRLFGDYYNTHVVPDDPYEFVELLIDQDLEATRRNNRLQDLAARVAASGIDLATLRDQGVSALDEGLRTDLREFCSSHQAMFTGLSDGDDLDVALDLVRLLAGSHRKVVAPGTAASDDLRQAFLDQFARDERAFAERCLDLGRASFRLRDDDNTYLGRLEHLCWQCRKEAEHRLREHGRIADKPYGDEELRAALRQPDHVPRPGRMDPVGTVLDDVEERQLVGQPAGPGIAKGVARVIRETRDLMQLREGEVLVCDALDPNMTVVIPLAAAIVERRGGMLIHGAIIAREYGIPCVTGIDQATTVITDGAELTVDGYLGIVRVSEDP